MTDTDVTLAEAIAEIRKELQLAVDAGADEAVQFALGPVELEFRVDVKKGVEGKGGVKFWVVSADAKAQYTIDTTHRIKLTLQPVTAAGEVLQVASAQSTRDD